MFRAVLTVAALLSSFASGAVIQNVHILGVTNTQAVLTYEAPDETPCVLAVSEDRSFSPLVHDVNPAKFPGANLDDRAGNISRGRNRTFIIGKRSADLAADGNRYSRALQAETVHYYRLECPAAEPAVGEFTTDTIRLGRTYTEPQPEDRSHPGEYAWPTISMTDRSERIVDPQTGALIRRVSLPGDRTYTQGARNQAMTVARSTVWKNPTTALTDDAQAATVSGDNAGTLFLSSGSSGYFAQFHAGYLDNYRSLNWYQVTLKASASNPACDSSPSDDCKIIVCLTLDGVTCYPGSRRFESSLQTKVRSFIYGDAGKPVDLWQRPGVTPPNSTEIAVRVGTLSCAGNMITRVSGDFFSTLWRSGSGIRIDGKDYRIASIAGLTQATLENDCASGTHPFSAANFGALIRKKTASPDIVSVQVVSVSYQVGIFPFWDDSGDYDLCSTTTVAGPNGSPGYNCSTYQQGPVYWIDKVTGEAHLIALNQGRDNSPTAACGGFDSSPFDTTDADVWYCGGPQPQRVRYFGNHSEPPGGHLEEGVNLPACDSSTHPGNKPCLAFATLTGKTNLGALTKDFDPEFQSDRFLNWYLIAIDRTRLIFRNNRSIYGTIGWTVVFDPDAESNGEPGNAGCVGGGQRGCVVAAMPSWNRPGARWCTQKSNDNFGISGWNAIGPYYWGGPGNTTAGAGPYQSQVIDGIAFKDKPGSPGGLTNCPANSFGVTGPKCTVVRVDGEPRDLSPCTESAAACNGAVETGKPGEIGNAAPGDYFTVGPEQVRLLVKDVNRWTLQRGFSPAGVKTSGPNPTLTAACNSVPDPPSAGQPNGEFFWNYAADPHGRNAQGKTILDDPYSINSHFFGEKGMYINSSSSDPRCPATDIYYYCYQARLYQAIPELVKSKPSVFVQQNPFFAGKYGPAQGNEVQMHPAGPGVSTSGIESKYFWDGRPFNGGPLSGSTLTSDGGANATLVTGQLWKFKASQLLFMDRKFLPTFAFSGHKPLVDISSPKSRIGSDAKSAYEYCVANVPGECAGDSSRGDLYVNAPYITYPFCHTAGQAGQMPDEFDICVGNNSMVYDSIMQIGMEQTDGTGKYERMISKAFTMNRVMVPFYHPHALPDAGWIITHTSYAGNVGDMVFAIKVPSIPPQDGIKRNDFVPVQVHVEPPPNVSATNALVQFGYAEWGAPSSYYCTSRAEACAVALETINETTPFYFATTEGTQLRGVPCTRACSISIPGISGRVLYYQVLFRNGSGAVVATGEPAVFVVP